MWVTRLAAGIVIAAFLAAACGAETTQPPADPQDAVGTTATNADGVGNATAAPSDSEPAETPSTEAPIVTTTPPPDASPEGTEPPPSTAPTPSTDRTPGEVDPALALFVETATADLASRLGVGEGDITVLAAELVVWPDSALGCPQPGMAYTQVQVDGFRIVLFSKGEQFAYHGGGSRGPFLCEKSEG